MGVERVGPDKIVPIERLRRNQQNAQAEARRKDHRTASSEAAAGQRAKADSGRKAAEAKRRSTKDAAQPPARGSGSVDATPLSGEDRDRLAAELKAELSALPEVRRDKVIEAKLRISTGYYDREEIRRQILRSVLASMRGSEATAGDRPDESPSDPPVEGPAGEQP